MHPKRDTRQGRLQSDLVGVCRIIFYDGLHGEVLNDYYNKGGNAKYKVSVPLLAPCKTPSSASTNGHVCFCLVCFCFCVYAFMFMCVYAFMFMFYVCVHVSDRDCDCASCSPQYYHTNPQSIAESMKNVLDLFETEGFKHPPAKEL